MLYEVDLNKTIAYTMQVEAESEDEAIALAEEWSQEQNMDLNEWDEVGSAAFANPAQD